MRIPWLNGDWLVPLREVAKALGVCKRTVERMIEAGLLPAPVRHGAGERFRRRYLPESAVLAYKERMMRERER